MELHLPLPMGLEPIDPRHPGTAALVRGPLVLMAVKPDIDAPVPVLSRTALLNPRRTGPAEWRAEGVGGQTILAPFTQLGARPYTTYLDLA